MDITPLIPEGRQIIEAYGNGGFRVSGIRYNGSVLVTPARTLAWKIGDFRRISPTALGPLFAMDYRPEILLLGCGAEVGRVPEEIRQAARAHGMVVEAMQSGAACRTYNVLLGEERLVAAAIIAVD